MDQSTVVEIRLDSSNTRYMDNLCALNGVGMFVEYLKHEYTCSRLATVRTESSGLQIH